MSHKNGAAPRKYKDFRELLAKEKPEIVIVGTPDHWHPLITIAAVQAGAHVYVEKPISHNLLEGVRMVEAAAKYQRVVQVGTQQRSGSHFKSAIDYVNSGKLGTVYRDGEVIAELQRGYRLGDRLLRAAMGKVAKAGASGTTTRCSA